MSEPVIKVEDILNFRVRPWLLNEGTVTIKVTYSDGKREIL